MTLTLDAIDTFAARRDRARELGARYDFAQEPLRLYLALVDAQERAFERAQDDRPGADDVADYVVRVALPGVMEAAVAAGPEALREAVLLRFHEGDLEGIVEAWLRGEETSGTDEFLARAGATPVLEALPEVAHALRGAETDERRCPRCGGLPQLAVFADSGEALVTSQRKLVCARCANEWVLSRMTCASCGETAGGKMPILSDVDYFPHLRLDACEMCRRYLITVDLRRDPRAVPIVDELVALPLDLAAAERGYTKIARNLMGF
ncbi:MAG TPA: formate dehydrogenase accessory protein FdhE [Candidatus Limnocylindria bacterium]|jgi:formate dehydrogenase accessory protein FdhE|nr:formate dehydrogenase accessory protein FdhE [Candidatus Limnocylindria bacterium]